MRFFLSFIILMVCIQASSSIDAAKKQAGQEKKTVSFFDRTKLLWCRLRIWYMKRKIDSLIRNFNKKTGNSIALYSSNRKTENTLVTCQEEKKNLKEKLPIVEECVKRKYPKNLNESESMSFKDFSEHCEKTRLTPEIIRKNRQRIKEKMKNVKKNLEKNRDIGAIKKEQNIDMESVENRENEGKHRDGDTFEIMEKEFFELMKTYETLLEELGRANADGKEDFEENIDEYKEMIREYSENIKTTDLGNEEKNVYIENSLEQLEDIDEMIEQIDNMIKGISVTVEISSF